jgi:hypothetical protein
LLPISLEKSNSVTIMGALRLLKTFFLLVFCAYSQAQSTFYSNNTTSNFNTLSGWSSNTDGTGANPGALNNTVRLIVQNGHSKTTSGVATVNQLTIQDGGTVTANHAITVNGTGLAFTINNGGTYIHNNTGVLSSTIFAGTETFGASSNFQINNWNSASVTLNSSLSATGGFFYGNLIINWTGNTAIWQQGWNTAIISLCAGNLDVQSTGTGSLAFATNRQPTLQVNGNFSMSGGNLIFRTNNGGGTAVYVYLDVAGNVNMSSGSMTTGGNTAIGVIRSSGTGSSSWTFTGGTRQYVAYEVPAGKTVQLASNLDMGSGILGDKLVVAGTLDAQSFLISDQTVVSSPNYVGCLVAGTFRTSSPDGFVGLPGSSLSSSPAPLQARFAVGCTIEYYRPGTQTVSQAPSSYIPYGYENITLTGVGSKQLQGNTTVDKVLSFAAAGNYLNIGSNNLLISATGSISGAGSNAYIVTQPTTAVNGRLQQDALPAADRVFPIGTATQYLPATITPATAGSNFSLSVFTGTTINGVPGGSSFDAASRQLQVNSVWRIDRAAGTSNAHIRLDWFNNAPLEGSSFTPLHNNQIGIWRETGSGWLLVPPPSAFSNSNTTNFASTAATAISSFGTAGTGMPYIVANVNVLPGLLRSFEVTPYQQQVRLNWEVEQTAPISHFELQRSNNQQSFTTVHNRPATLHTSYSYNDLLPAPVTWYYRLKLVDLSGNVTYSKTIVVNWQGLRTSLRITGNPVRDQLNFGFTPSSHTIQYRITDLAGTVRQAGQIPASVSLMNLQVGHLPFGVYSLQILYADGSTETTRFLRR